MAKIVTAFSEKLGINHKMFVIGDYLGFSDGFFPQLELVLCLLLH